MKHADDRRGQAEGTIRCSDCREFRYFPNEKGHNSPHALGKCEGDPWDGNRGQWAMFQHHCRNFAEKAAGDPDPSG
jgi:hypothetical protein